MINKLQRRFVITAMTAISLLLFIMLAALNVSNAVLMYKETGQLLDALSEPEPIPHKNSPPQRPDIIFDTFPSENAKMGAVYFSVSFDPNGEPVNANVSRIATISRSDAFQMANLVSAEGSEKGCLDGFRYKRTEMPDSGYKITFLDTGRQWNFVLRTALLSAFAGLLCWLLMLLLVVILSKKAILPIAQNLEKQRRFVTDAGHELKTPLAIILANTEAMELHTGQTKYSKNIRNQVSRLTGLTKNLLTLARFDEDRPLENVESFDFSALVRDTAAMFRESAELKRLTVQSSVQDGLFLRGNREQLTQLLSILMDNAVKYSPENGEISVKLTGAEHLLLELRNSVSSADIPTELMFDRFYRADESRSQKSGGYGIGLSAAQAIVQNHGGSISAEYDGSDTICFKVKI